MGKNKKDSPKLSLDDIDLQILKRLQEDGRISNSKLSELVALSETPCWRRWKNLEEEGYIEEYRTVLNRRKLGFGVVVFTQVSLSSHNIELTNQFEQTVKGFDWVQMCHCVSGNVDYLLQMVVRDLDEFSDRITMIRHIPGVNSVQSQISVKEIKNSSTLPLG